MQSNPAVVAAGFCAASAALVGCCALRRGSARADDSDDEGASFVSNHTGQPAPPPTKLSAQERRIDLQKQKMLEKERRMMEEEQRQQEEEEERRRLAKAQASKSQSSSPTTGGPDGLPEQKPQRQKNTCATPPGALVRDGRTLVPEVRPDQRRSNFPSPPPKDQRSDVESLWKDVSEEEWYHRRKDASRWAWFDFTIVDSRKQIVSVQHEYVDPTTGLRIIVLPTLRLADAQFFDSLADEMRRQDAFVLAETLHSDPATELQLKKEEENQKESYQKETDEAVREMGLRHCRASGKIGGDCVALGYLRVLINYRLRWKLGDTALDEKEMIQVSEDVNTREAFAALCQKRERYLIECIDEIIDAAEDPEWRTPAGGRIVALPWNGRHCVRLERYLVQCRGFTPEPAKCVHRIVFDPAQTMQMVLSANREDEELEKEKEKMQQRESAEAQSPRAQAKDTDLPASPVASPRESTPGGSSGAPRKSAPEEASAPEGGGR